MKRTVNPINSCVGCRKFFFPLIMKEPVLRYSPEGAVLETWLLWTHQDPVVNLEFQAWLWQTQKLPASSRVVGGMGPPPTLFLTTQEAAP